MFSPNVPLHLNLSIECMTGLHSGFYDTDSEFQVLGCEVPLAGYSGIRDSEAQFSGFPTRKYSLDTVTRVSIRVKVCTVVGHILEPAYR